MCLLSDDNYALFDNVVFLSRLAVIVENVEIHYEVDRKIFVIFVTFPLVISSML